MSGVLAEVGACSLAYGDNDERRCSWCGAALTGRRRRWCSETCQSAYGVNHWWTSARQAAKARDGGRCVRCGAAEDSATVFAGFRLVRSLLAVVGYPARTLPWSRYASLGSLQVNHKTPILGRHGESGCHHHLDGLETLCRPCHLAETALQFGRSPGQSATNEEDA